ncbi:MAG TPA: endolytic transglycosylase MltG, partial [Acidobacteriota bacterium]
VVTIPEGSSLYEIEFILESRRISAREQFRQTLNSQPTLAALRNIDPAVSEAEGFLFPETYFLGKKDGIQELLLLMLRQFQKHFGEPQKRRAAQLGMTTLQAITLASLIEEETGESSERPLVSGVFHNRLKKSMLLQCDPTVIYAMKMTNEYEGTLLRKDLERDSPYNTYRYAGLPPGPICNPGVESIRAALYPRESEMLYFVSKNDGTHYFSATLQEHNQAVQRFRRN